MKARPGHGPHASPHACRCEARIASGVLDGYACGDPDCWRTAEAKASFDAFVSDLIRARGDGAPAAQATEPPPR